MECLPSNLPEKIELDVNELRLGHSLHVRELPPVEGVRFLNSPEQVVCAVVHKRVEVEAPVAAAVPAEGEEAARRGRRGGRRGSRGGVAAALDGRGAGQSRPPVPGVPVTTSVSGPSSCSPGAWGVSCAGRGSAVTSWAGQRRRAGRLRLVQPLTYMNRSGAILPSLLVPHGRGRRACWWCATPWTCRPDSAACAAGAPRRATRAWLRSSPRWAGPISCACTSASAAPPGRKRWWTTCWAAPPARRPSCCERGRAQGRPRGCWPCCTTNRKR